MQMPAADREERVEPREGPGFFAGYRQVLFYFTLTRLFLTAIGTLARETFPRWYGFRLEWDHPQQAWLDIWGQWDTGWYLDIAGEGYAPGVRFMNYPNYAFFPFYPVLMRIVGYATGDLFLAGLLISNVSLLMAGILLYRLALLDGGAETASRSVKYLFLWPTSFILSGVLSESLFLALILGCFYAARRGRWLAAGACGFFAALTRSTGVLVLLPLLHIYLRKTGFRPARIRPDIAFLLLLPLGLSVFAAYNYHLTGNSLAFVDAQAAWGRDFGNPARILLQGMDPRLTRLSLVFSAWWGFLALGALVLFFRKFSFPEWLLCFLFLIVPLSTGVASMPRYTSVLFPFFLLFARLGERSAVDQALTAAAAMLLAGLMVFWSVGHHLVV